METKFKVENGKLIIETIPTESVSSGLVIILDEMIPDEQNFMGRQPAIEHDLYEGVTEYDLPPGFDEKRIRSVELRQTTVKAY